MSSETFEKLWVPFSNTTQIIHNTNPGFSVFCRIYPYTLSGVAGTTPTTAQADIVPAARTNIIQYLGGPVMNRHAPEVWVIWWGSAWSSTNVTMWNGSTTVNAVSIKNALTNSFSTVVNSDYHLGLWQYGNLGLKKPRIGGHITHTATALPSSSAELWTTQIEAVVKNAMAAGQVPNADNFMEPTNIPGNGQVPPWNRMDFRHIYYVMVPPSRMFRYGGDLQPASAFAMRGTTTGNGIFQYDAGVIGTTSERVTWAEQSFGHELIHNMSNPMFYGAPGWGGYVQPWNDSQEARENFWYIPLNHSLIGVSDDCYASDRFRPLSGTNVDVDYYWSDMDGKCIAPGTGESWTRPPPTPPPLPPSPGPPPGPGPSPPPPFPSPPPGSTGGGLRCLWIKQDDKNNGAQALLGSDGTLYFNVKINNQRFKIRTNPGVVTSNAWHQIWCTFNKQTNAMDIYVDNVRYAIPSSINELWNDRHSHFIIGNSDTGSATAPFRGRIDDFRLYRNGVVTSQSVANMWDNNHTIDTVPTSEGNAVAIAGFIKLDEPLVINPVVTSVVSSDILTPSPPAPPPPPPGTDDAPLPPPPPPSPTPTPIVDDFGLTVASPTDPVPPITAEPVICEKEDIE